MSTPTKMQNLYHLLVSYFQRQNPVLMIVGQVQASLNFVMTYQSNVKLNRFRHSLYVQQLKRMEGFIAQGSPYEAGRGEKINRQF